MRLKQILTQTGRLAKHQIKGWSALPASLVPVLQVEQQGRQGGVGHRAASGLLLAITAGAGLTYAASPLVAEAEAEAPKVSQSAATPRSVGQRPDITLYQYEVCPFCCKVKAFLDFYKLPYKTVEVNPLFKSELKWSEYRKVPVALVDGRQMNDSSAIITQLATDLQLWQPLEKLQQQQQAAAPQSKGSSWKPWGRQKARVQEERAVPHSAAEALDEERRWREWVDERLVKVVTVNIYRNWAETFQTFDYITETGKFTWAERHASRIVGAVMMWAIAGRLKRKYGIFGDEREELYATAQDWVNALGARDFLGGTEPNLADISVFGVVRAVTGTNTFMDLMHNTEISRWYERMMGKVGESSRTVAV